MSEQRALVPPVHILSVGSFGSAVVRYLTRFRGDVLETPVVNDTVPLPETWPRARCTMISAWRPASRLSELVEELCYRWQQPFLPLILEASALRIGPVVLPGEPPCWSCWVGRVRQHTLRPAEHSGLLEYYAIHPEEGPRGYLEPFAVMAAAQVSQVIAGLDSRSVPGGYFWQIDIISRDITTGVAVGIHDCPRCGLHRSVTDRSFSGLRDKLAYLWRPAAADPA